MQMEMGNAQMDSKKVMMMMKVGGWAKDLMFTKADVQVHTLCGAPWSRAHAEVCAAGYLDAATHGARHAGMP